MLSAARRSVLLTLALSLVAAEARAYPVNTWTEVTTPGTLGVAPFLYVYNSPLVVYPSLRVSYGISEHFDIASGVPFKLTFDPSTRLAWDEISLLLRWFPTPGVGLVLEGAWLPGSGFTVGPQLHVAQYGEHLSYIVNVGFEPLYDTTTHAWTPGSVWVYGGPEWWFSKRLSIFCEIDPRVDWVTEPSAAHGHAAWSLALVPGVGIGLDAAESHFMSVGLSVGFPWAGASSVSLGGWYWTSFDVGPHAPAEAESGPEAAK